MQRLPWLKLWKDARNDRKLGTLNDAEFRCWFNLLCFAGDQKEPGTIHDMEEDGLALEVSACDVDVLRSALAKLQKHKIVEVTLCNAPATPCNAPEGVALATRVTVAFRSWDERQRQKPSDSPEQRNERSRKHRENKRYGNSTEMQRPATPLQRPATPERRGEEKREEKRDEEERTHANPERQVIPITEPPKGEIKACPDLAWVDRLSEQIEDWFPGTGLAARVYDIAVSGGFRPEAVEYGFDEGYRMKCRGELMDEIRIVGLIRYAQERGLSVAMRLDKNGNPGESVTQPNVPFSQRKQLDFHVSRRRLAEMEAAKTREAV